VAFELVLVQTSSGRILWQRSFEEVQKSLSEDLLQLKSFLKRKGRWVSAREMAKGALKEMLETVPIFDTGR
jgi:4'-phosphopantetheinyl transferase EntD